MKKNKYLFIIYHLLKVKHKHTHKHRQNICGLIMKQIMIIIIIIKRKTFWIFFQNSENTEFRILFVQFISTFFKSININQIEKKKFLFFHSLYILYIYIKNTMWKCHHHRHFIFQFHFQIAIVHHLIGGGHSGGGVFVHQSNFFFSHMFAFLRLLFLSPTLFPCFYFIINQHYYHTNTTTTNTHTHTHSLTMT